MSNAGYTIQEAAERTGVSVHTLRYYERIGLLGHVKRALNGHRRYTNGDLGWIRFLALLRNAGMSIQQMRTFVELERDGDSTLKERCEMLEEHRQSLHRNIEDLTGHLQALEKKIEYYQGEYSRSRNESR